MYAFLPQFMIFIKLYFFKDTIVGTSIFVRFIFIYLCTKPVYRNFSKEIFSFNLRVFQMSNIVCFYY